MKNRSLPLLLTILPALVLSASGCTLAPTVCPAVGFVDLGPVELDLSALPAVTSVSACFGVDAADLVLHRTTPGHLAHARPLAAVASYVLGDSQTS